MAELGVKGTADHLLQIISEEGLVDRAKLELNARLDDIGISPDDIVLIGNAIEREFDRDILGDEELERCTTVQELLSFIGRRISNQGDA